MMAMAAIARIPRVRLLHVIFRHGLWIAISITAAYLSQPGYKKCRLAKKPPAGIFIKKLTLYLFNNKQCVFAFAFLYNKAIL